MVDFCWRSLKLECADQKILVPERGLIDSEQESDDIEAVGDTQDIVSTKVMANDREVHWSRSGFD